MANNLTVRAMRQGNANSGTGPVPTQTFFASNIAGTTVPKVGSAQSTTGTSLAGAFAQVQPTHIVIIVLVIIGAGYLLHHITFEESVGAREGLKA